MRQEPTGMESAVEQSSNVRPLRGRKVRDVGIHKQLRVRGEYGTGTIVSDMGTLGVGIQWDKRIVEDLVDQYLVHVRSWVEDLEVID